MYLVELITTFVRLIRCSNGVWEEKEEGGIIKQQKRINFQIFYLFFVVF